MSDTTSTKATRTTPTNLTRRGLMGAGAGLAAASLARAEEPGEPLVVYAVRHAEKQGGDDPALTEAGAARAEQLAAVLRDVPLRAALSTDTRRTRATAEPIARRRGLEVTLYEPAAQRGAVGIAGAVLVVGHSNTIPALLRALGADTPATELEGFDDLFVLVLPAGSTAPIVQRLHYGAPSGSSAAMQRH